MLISWYLNVSENFRGYLIFKEILCFPLEQQEYAKERLEWTNLNWSDNTPVIHLLGKKPVGILHLLDDESNFPKASDSSFLEKCHYNHALNENYCRPRVGGREFGVSWNCYSIIWNAINWYHRNSFSITISIFGKKLLLLERR